jgi:hypothetical protein
MGRVLGYLRNQPSFQELYTVVRGQDAGLAHTLVLLDAQSSDRRVGDIGGVHRLHTQMLRVGTTFCKAHCAFATEHADRAEAEAAAAEPGQRFGVGACGFTDAQQRGQVDAFTR